MVKNESLNAQLNQSALLEYTVTHRPTEGVVIHHPNQLDVHFLPKKLVKNGVFVRG